jgi:hypothetical protein
VDLPLQIHVACRIKTPEEIRTRRTSRADSFLGAFYGPPEQVKEALLSIGELGIDEVYIGPHDEYTYQQLARHLFE